MLGAHTKIVSELLPLSVVLKQAAACHIALGEGNPVHIMSGLLFLDRRFSKGFKQPGTVHALQLITSSFADFNNNS